MKEEIWKVYRDTRIDALGRKHALGHLYEVSNLGNVKIDGVLAIPWMKNGYYLVGSFYIHRAVAELFIPNPENKPFINHINYNRSCNTISNLEWCTAAENAQHSMTRITAATKAANDKAVIQLDLNGNVVAEYESLSEASRKTKINCGHICQCAKGHEKTAGGFKWQYRGQVNG